MAKLDNRRVRIGLQIGQNIEFFEDLEIYARGTKYATGINNEAEIRITNLNKANRDYFTTELSPFNKNQVATKKVIIEVGRQSGTLYRIFTGEVIRVQQTQPPDISLVFTAQTAAFYSTDIISKSLGTTNVSLVASEAAEEMSLNNEFYATDKSIQNYSFTGAKTKQIDSLNDMGNYRAFIDDDSLIMLDKNQPIPNRNLILNENTGMIGQPNLDIQGVSVTCLLDAKPSLGGTFTIQSKVYPVANGTYNIYRQDFELGNRSEPFYWNLRGSRPSEVLFG